MNSVSKGSSSGQQWHSNVSDYLENYPELSLRLHDAGTSCGGTDHLSWGTKYIKPLRTMGVRFYRPLRNIKTHLCFANLISTVEKGKPEAERGSLKWLTRSLLFIECLVCAGHWAEPQSRTPCPHDTSCVPGETTRRERMVTQCKIIRWSVRREGALWHSNLEKEIREVSLGKSLENIWRKIHI